MRQEPWPLEGLDVEVNIDGVWTPGRAHGLRSSAGSKQTLVRYEPAEADLSLEQWFSTCSIRAVHVNDRPGP
jgi:hypothetical protein